MSLRAGSYPKSEVKTGSESWDSWALSASLTSNYFPPRIYQHPAPCRRAAPSALQGDGTRRPPGGRHAAPYKGTAGAFTRRGRTKGVTRSVDWRQGPRAAECRLHRYRESNSDASLLRKASLQKASLHFLKPAEMCIVGSTVPTGKQVLESLSDI